MHMLKTKINSCASTFFWLLQSFRITLKKATLTSVSLASFLCTCFFINFGHAAQVQSFTLFNGLRFYFLPSSSSKITYKTYLNVAELSCSERQDALFLLHVFNSFVGDKLVSANKAKVSLTAQLESNYLISEATVDSKMLPRLLKAEAANLYRFPLTQKEVGNFSPSLYLLPLQKQSPSLGEDYDIVNYYLSDRAEFCSVPKVISYSLPVSKQTYEALQGLYTSYFVPTNIKVVVTGNIDLKTLKRLAIKYYNKIPRPRESMSRQQSRLSPSAMSSAAYTASEIAVSSAEFHKNLLILAFKSPELSLNEDINSVLAALLFMSYVNANFNNTSLADALHTSGLIFHGMSVDYSLLAPHKKLLLVFHQPKVGVRSNLPAVHREISQILDEWLKRGLTLKECQNELDKLKSDKDFAQHVLTSLILSGFSATKAKLVLDSWLKTELNADSISKINNNLRATLDAKSSILLKITKS